MSGPPPSGIALGVKTGYNREAAALDLEENAVGEAAQQGAPEIAMKHRKALRLLDDVFQNGTD